MTVARQLAAHRKDIGGGFTVSRLLPSAQQRSVGPFIFFDHFGPVVQTAGANHDVRPHPHIGLATVTYLFEGAMMHRDSLGSEQLIEPGAINWMTSGRGIVHSERRPEHLKGQAYSMHGLQLWTALPLAHEEDEPSFVHTPAEDIPEVVVQNARVRILVGAAFGEQSPVAALSPTLYLDVSLPAGGMFDLPLLQPEMALYAVQGVLHIDGIAQPEGVMSVMGVNPSTGSGRTVVGSGRTVVSSGSEATRFVVIGGEPLDAPRHLWWNFVSSRKERILQAAADWEAQRMGKVPGDDEFIPLPPPRFTPPQPLS